MTSARNSDIEHALSLFGLTSAEHPTIVSALSSIGSVTFDGLVYDIGDVAEHLFIIAGHQKSQTPFVTLRAAPDEGAKDVSVARIFEGSFGELEYLRRDETNSPPERALRCWASAPIRLIRLPYRTIRSLDSSARSTIERHLARAAAERMLELSQKLWLSKSVDNLTQLAHAILTLAEDAGAVEGRGRRISIGLTQKDLANEVGISREAVNAHLTEWERAGLLSMSPNQIRIPDLERFRRIVDAGLNGTRQNLQRVLTSIDRSLGSGDHFRARNLALDGLRFFPNSAELKYRAFLAASRSGAVDEAGTFLESLLPASNIDVAEIRRQLRDGLTSPQRSSKRRATQRHAEEIDDTLDDEEDARDVERHVNARVNQLLEDVLAARGRMFKENAFSVAGASQTALLQSAAETYSTAFDATHGTFAAINAASLHYVAGNRSQAALLATAVLSDTGRASDYWSLAAKGEALLLLGRTADAGIAFAKAARATGSTPGSIATTRKQIFRLSPSLGLSRTEASALLPQIGVMTYSGHLPPRSGRGWLNQFAVTQHLVSSVIKRRNIGIAYGALAAGSDQICARAALEAGVALNIVLPLTADEFRRTSVTPYVGPDDERIFDDVLAASGSLRILAQERQVSFRSSELEDRIHFANRQALGLALLRADELESDAVALVIYDDTATGSRAGTAQFVKDCEAALVPVEIVSCPWKHQPGSSSRTRKTPQHNLYAPVVFAWLRTDGRADTGADKAGLSKSLLKAAGLSSADATPDLQLAGSSDAWRGFAFARPSTGDAIAVARALLEGARACHTPISLLCDIGPVRRPDGSCDQGRVRKLSGADTGITLPAGQMLASEAFAAEARLDAQATARFVPVGRLVPTGSGTHRTPAASRQFFSLIG